MNKLIVLEEIIENKIKGECAYYISFLNCKNWHDLQNALLIKYGDQRNIIGSDDKIQAMNSKKPKRGIVDQHLVRIKDC